ncbi:ECF transporter S component [Streptococcus koreensis]|uniref:ECF transporter S component n=1 Tax=Streptococcus koreensis TaxID=2382163 RepID=A0ABN5PZ32_9STRE|nr:MULTISPECIES: ECF transporter S component [Streptococcus]AYF94557.1 ECF transporter S component [Streptococcus koreensis]RGM73897.1 ECF transporter S component [Streptococcus ilei]RJU25046.1 ECF transporter S component [Streptococcus sp. AM43-2AT]
MKKSSSISRIAIFFAVMITIHFTTSFILHFVPSGIQPTLVHIPVVIASIIYGPRTGAILGLLMGLFSLTMNTLVLTPASYLFSPFVPNGNLYSLVIAIVPRILIGVTPYFVYRWMHNRTGLITAGIVGSMTNTVFVLSGIYLFFGNTFGRGIQHFLGLIVSTNSLIEVIATVLITSAVVPALEKLK